MKFIQNVLDIFKITKKNNGNTEKTADEQPNGKTGEKAENNKNRDFLLEYAESEIMTESGLREQRRRYYRFPADWTVHFKIIKPDSEYANALKKWHDEKIFESDGGRLKIKMIDVSAGGFKSIIKKYLPKGTGIECIIEIDGSKITSEPWGIIIGKVVDCTLRSEDHEKYEKYENYDIRVKFISMSGEMREFIINRLMFEAIENKS